MVDKDCAIDDKTEGSDLNTREASPLRAKVGDTETREVYIRIYHES